MNNWTRKEFLKTTLVGSGAAFAAGRMYGQTAAKPGSANGQIRVAVVGVNAQGRGHMMDYASGELKPARLVAICDVDSKVLAERKAQAEKAGEKDGIKVETYEDYRKLLENPNIDAVVLGTPNHQHSLQTIWALQAGKDVYVEKPLSHNVWEGRQAVEAARKYSKNIVQAGTQNRSSEDIMEAIEYVRAGKLGKVQWARGTCYKTRDSIGKTSGPQQVPAHINYDLWTGPAELTPPRRNGSKGPVHYDWHWFWNTGGGDITNQGIHQMDVARWLLGAKGLPQSVVSFGGRFGYVDDAETPNTLVSVFQYAEGVPLIFEVRGLPRKTGMRAMDVYRQSSIGAVLQCENGYVHISEAGTGGIYDNNNKRIQGLAKGGNKAHRANFVKALQTRKVVHGLIEECHYSSALCHLGNLSYLVGKERSNSDISDSIKADAHTKEAFGRVMEHLKANDVNPDSTKTILGPLLKIDPKKEIFVGSEPFVKAANSNALLKREGRGAFKIPVMQNGAIAVS